MLLTRRLLLGLASLLCLAGCQGIGEKEAQLEFEKLRQRTISPQGDRLQPDFERKSTSAEARRRDPRCSTIEWALADLEGEDRDRVSRKVPSICQYA